MKRRRFLTEPPVGAILYAAIFASSLFGTVAPTLAQDAPQPVQSVPFAPPALESEGGWIAVVLPDPQAYSRYGRNQGIFDLIAAWIAENKDALAIRQVLCVGDLVESNNLRKADGKYANQTSAQMWRSTSRAFERLDGVLPYVLCTGNHDYGPEIWPDGNHYGVRSSENRETQFNDFFPIDRNPALDGVLVETFENAFGRKSLENAAYEFEGTGGQKILTVALEFAPRPETVAWAKNLFASPKYADHFGILLTHSFIRGQKDGAKRTENERYKISKEGGADGVKLWNELVYPSKNVRLVVCGHISAADDFDGCVGFRVDKNETGKDVAQLLFDVQAVGGGWEGNGGDGWIQLLEFSKDMKTVKVRTFSPLFAISPSTRDKAWNRSERCEFEFRLD